MVRHAGAADGFLFLVRRRVARCGPADVLSVAGYYRGGVSALLRSGECRAGSPPGDRRATRGVGILC